MMNNVSDVACLSHSRSPHPRQDKILNKKVLVVDDESLIRYSLKSFVEGEGFIAITADSALNALKSIEEANPHIVILDINLPDSNGLALLKTIKETNPRIIVIMITGCADVQSTVEAMKRGALDYLEKPIDFDKLKAILDTTKDERAADAKTLPTADFVFTSTAMKEVARIKERLATKTDVTILVLGESGTGKSFLCKIMHELSPRKGKPFVEIGCSNIPEHLIESELFGHEKGAFTDAKAAKKGLIEMAEGGTVFLDEIGDMPYPMQSKILSLIEERKFRRVGGLQNIHADVRIFAATNRNLYDLVQAKKFRLDLYYRLNVVTIEMPPLRERKEDIPVLVQHYLKRYSEKYHCTCKGISQRALNFLQEHSWQGNIRELKNLIEKLVILAKCEKIDIDDLPPILFEQKNAGAPSKKEEKVFKHDEAGKADAGSRNGLSLKVMEAEYIKSALKLADGNQRKAARLLDISRDTLRYRLKKLGIDSASYTS